MTPRSTPYRVVARQRLSEVMCRSLGLIIGKRLLPHSVHTMYSIVIRSIFHKFSRLTRRFLNWDPLLNVLALSGLMWPNIRCLYMLRSAQDRHSAMQSWIWAQNSWLGWHVQHWQAQSIRGFVFGHFTLPYVSATSMGCGVCSSKLLTKFIRRARLRTRHKLMCRPWISPEWISRSYPVENRVVGPGLDGMESLNSASAGSSLCSCGLVPVPVGPTIQEECPECLEESPSTMEFFQAEAMEGYIN